jgi:hypothetical protein
MAVSKRPGRDPIAIGKRPGRSQAQKVEDVRLVGEALAMYEQGKTTTEIAAAQGCHRMTAWRRVQKALVGLWKPNAEEVLALELAGCEQDEFTAVRLIESNIDAAETGDEERSRIVLGGLKARDAVREKRARFLGLYKADKHEHTGKDGGPIELDGAHDDVLSRLARLAAAVGAGTGDPGPEQGGGNSAPV